MDISCGARTPYLRSISGASIGPTSGAAQQSLCGLPDGHLYGESTVEVDIMETVDDRRSSRSPLARDSEKQYCWLFL